MSLSLDSFTLYIFGNIIIILALESSSIVDTFKLKISSKLDPGVAKYFYTEF